MNVLVELYRELEDLREVVADIVARLKEKT